MPEDGEKCPDGPATKPRRSRVRRASPQASRSGHSPGDSREKTRTESAQVPIPQDPSTAEWAGVTMEENAADGGHSLLLSPRDDVYEDAELRSIQSRALVYLQAGAPVHFRGPAGMGKTTLALHIAAQCDRPVALVIGDSAMTSADLLGAEIGTDQRKVSDRYIHSVQKTEIQNRVAWVDNVLTRAVSNGYTLVYDEFTRAPPEANNALLSALEERILVISNPARGRRYIRAHPEFRAIFTSNPDEYVGVAAAPDALYDRMITFDLTWSTAETETGIVSRRTGLNLEDAAQVVDVVRALRLRTDSANPPSTRTAIMIAQIMKSQGIAASSRDERFVQICLDVLETRAPRSADPAERAAYLGDLRTQILSACPAEQTVAAE